MFGRLLPKETSFFDFFEQHAALTVAGTKEFVSMVASGANIDAKARCIKEIEHETDVITHRCVEALHRTFITPIERDDIHRLITRMDDVMDYVEAASERIALYAHENGFPVITSSLGISRWKNMAQINDCGIRAASRYEGLQYWDYNWRKGGGASRMIEISKREQFYQQEYCGCVYSLRDANRHRRENGRERIKIGLLYYGQDAGTPQGD